MIVIQGKRERAGGEGWETKVNGNFKPLLFLVSAIHSFLAESFSATSKHKHKNGNVMDERREEKEEDFPRQPHSQSSTKR